jgi:hypothetical protein
MQSIEVTTPSFIKWRAPEHGIDNKQEELEKQLLR